MRWIGLALLGILVAAAVAFAASRLASQQIGLASEPVTAGDALAPKRIEHTGAAGHRSKRHTSPTPKTVPAEPIESAEPPAYTPTTPTAPPEPRHSDRTDGEHGGGGGGRGGGGGADD